MAIASGVFVDMPLDPLLRPGSVTDIMAGPGGANWIMTHAFTLEPVEIADIAPIVASMDALR
jgi:hypothetical protein